MRASPLSEALSVASPFHPSPALREAEMGSCMTQMTLQLVFVAHFRVGEEQGEKFVSPRRSRSQGIGPGPFPFAAVSSSGLKILARNTGQDFT
jgi:hypothetical protein